MFSWLCYVTEKKTQVTLQAIRSLREFTRPYAWAIPVLVVLNLAASLAEGLGIGLILPLLDSFLQQPGDTEPSGPLAVLLRDVAQFVGADRAILVLSALIVGLVGLKTMILALDAVVSTGVIARAMQDLRSALCRQLLAVSYEYFSREPQGKLINLLDTQTYRASEALRALTVLIGSLCTAVVFGTLLLLLSWQLALVVVALVAPVSLVIRQLAVRAHSWGEQLVKSYSALSERILELLVSMRTIRIFNREELEAQRFDAAAQDVKRAYRRTELINQLLPVLVEFLYVPVFVAVLAIAWYLQIGVPTVLVFMLLLYRLQNPLKQLNASRVMLASRAAGIRDLQDLLDESDKPYLRSGSQQFEKLREGIEFDRVTFSYLGSETATLRDVSLTLRSGSVNAIVGDSGAGKSTLINLLCRLHDPQSGAVRADGRDLRESDLRSWRSRIAFAGQDAELLSGSVRFNITYGVDDATDEAVTEAARIAQAHEFIAQLPAAYQSEVGPGGSRLSGGQRQRIALARAILRQPDILILDEATNAVDGVTEMAIQAAIERLADHTTVVLVAHRLNTLKRAQHVVVMSRGRVVQEGAPHELLAVPGPLAELYAAHHELEDAAPAIG
jgi:ATP-binding cassette, subfamily B, bacterial MsbA